MASSDEVRGSYNKKAAIYDVLVNPVRSVYQLRRLLFYILGQIPETNNTLDMGCGTGLATETILKKFPNTKIVAVDCSEEMLNIFSKEFHDLKIVLGDYNEDNSFSIFPTKEPTSLLHSSFGLVVSVESVTEYGDLKTSLSLVKNILTQDGVFIAIGIKKHIGSLIMGKIWHFKTRNEEEFSDACKAAGFSSVRNIHIQSKFFPLNYTRYVVIARR